MAPRARFHERARDQANDRIDALAFGDVPPADPVEAIRALAARIDAARAGEIDVRDLANDVALAWGARICSALGWAAVELREREGRMLVSVNASPDRRYHVDLRAYAARLLSSEDANTLVLLHSMLESGSHSRPQSPARTWRSADGASPAATRVLPRSRQRARSRRKRG